MSTSKQTYPPASSERVRRRMLNTPTRDTLPELALRSALHRRGLRYRVDRPPLPGMRRRADLVFASARVAVFVDGCFWHGCEVHKPLPKTNAEWWAKKLSDTRIRDLDTDRRLRDAGWLSIRVWEHDGIDDAAERVECVVRARTSEA
jgi:DNA mismatch endonuclease (patch repair protein)